MADNVTLNAGTGGDTISADDIGGGVKVQRVKVQHGANGTATDVSAEDPLPVRQALGAIATEARIATSNVSTTLLAANANRTKAWIVNDSAQILYVRFAAGASSTTYTVRLGSYSALEITLYSGLVSGALDSGTGNAQVTEIT